MSLDERFVTCLGMSLLPYIAGGDNLKRGGNFEQVITTYHKRSEE